jgi:hypothetical protein
MHVLVKDEAIFAGSTKVQFLELGATHTIRTCPRKSERSVLRYSNTLLL